MMFKNFIANNEALSKLKEVNSYNVNGREYLSKKIKYYCIER